MKSICAWCFPNVSQGEDMEPVTHGICPRHMEQIQREAIAYWRKEGKEIKEEFGIETGIENTIGN